MLLFSVFALSLCGIIYELVLGSLATYLLGNPVLQYSITIGVFLSSMGLGSFLSRFFTRDLTAVFVRVEIALGLAGGLSVLVLSSLFSFSASYYLLNVFFLVLVGTMVGLEIPLLTRMLKRSGSLKDILASVLSLDYLGGLAGSLLFPLLLFPFAGRLLTSILVGIANILVAILVMVKVSYSGKRKSDIAAAVLSVLLLGTLAFASERISTIFQKRLYYDDIVYTGRSKYQEIVLTRNEDDFRLYLSGSLQFSSVDEYRYHEMLVYPPMLSCAGEPEDVLVLGGGDGLAVREVLRFPSVKSVTLVELDREIIRLATKNPSMVRINGGSLSRPGVRVIVDDAYNYLIAGQRKFDVIIADFPDPHDETTAKLYTVEFFGLIKRSLKEGGMFVTQSTSPLFASKAFWCVNVTMKKVFASVVPYHAYVPTFGDWGYNMASNRSIDPAAMREPPVKLRFFSRETFDGARHFTPDVMESGVAVNTFNRPVLYSYYLKGWRISVD